MTDSMGILVATEGWDKTATVIVLLSISLPLSVAVLWLVWRHEKKRTESWRQQARRLNLRFFEKGDDSLLEQLQQFHLFSQGRSKKISNMLHGETEQGELAIFDYRYRTGGGKNSSTYRQSVLYLSSPSLDLPHFELRPEGVLHKIVGAFGYQDFDFARHPKFSKTYVLRGENERAVRELFEDEVLEFFEGEAKVCIEGGGQQLLFYRQRRRIKPEEAAEFMKEGFRLFAPFRA